jgi:hypothetical protein
MARRKAILCRSPSFAAYVAAALEAAPAAMTSSHFLQLQANELLLKMHAGRSRTRTTGESQKGNAHADIQSAAPDDAAR